MKTRIKQFLLHYLILTLAFGVMLLAPSHSRGADASAEVSFCPPGNIFIDAGALDVLAADLNLDGKIDLATANRDSDDVVVLLGSGSGSFAPAAGSPFGAGDTPVALAAGDFNSDGIVDLAVANANSDSYGSNAVTVLLGSGSGAFTSTPLPPFPGPIQVDDVAAGDFNQDGNLDIAVANTSYNEVSIYFGSGAGGFVGPAGYALNGALPTSISVADFNTDGKPDLGISNALSNDVDVLLGDGAGAFSPAPGSPFPAGDFPLRLEVADFSGDGRPDMAVTNFNSRDVTVLVADGLGGFTGTDVAVGGTVIDVKAGDFDMDGSLDLALSNTTAPNGSTVGIMLGDGDGGYNPITNYATNGYTATSLAVADFDGDGRLDMASANAESGDLSTFLRGCEPCAGPLINNLSVTPDRLGVPNHKMREVMVSYDVTGGCGAVTSTLSVTSDEPISGTGDGDTAPDWEVLDAHHVRLRAERSGNGDGRVYTITVTSTDAAGNTSVDTVTVNVPHD